MKYIINLLLLTVLFFLYLPLGLLLQLISAWHWNRNAIDFNDEILSELYRIAFNKPKVK